MDRIEYSTETATPYAVEQQTRSFTQSIQPDVSKPTYRRCAVHYCRRLSWYVQRGRLRKNPVTEQVGQIKREHHRLRMLKAVGGRNRSSVELSNHGSEFVA